MDAISSRTLFAAAAALFSLTLGLIALFQNPRYRLNRNYAFYTLTLAVLQVPATIMIEARLGHATALFTYRLVQFALPVSSYFLICFLQEFGGIYAERRSVGLRRLIQVSLLLLAPFYFTPYVIRDFSAVVQGTDVRFVRDAGPFYLVNILMFLILMSVAAVTTIGRLRTSIGVKKNQMRFVAAGLALGFLSMFFYFLSFSVRDWPWLYQPLQMGMTFCFAFAIFKYQLFEFGVWMQRAAIYVGVYVALLSLPFFIFFPFRGALFAEGPGLWGLLTAVTVAYGVAFALAPFLTGYLRTKAGRKKLLYLRQQLEAVRESSEQLSDESGLTREEIARRVVGSLRNFYWDRMNTPLRFVFVALIDPPSGVVLASHPAVGTNDESVGQFLASLAALPADFLKEPFSVLDIEKRFQSRGVGAASGEFALAKRYLEENEIEVCAPCLHSGRLMGAILLGAKTKGILWKEELNAIQLAASHAAMAVRKSELLTHNKELRDLDQLKTELIHNITHEFKTPLQVVENAMDVLMKDVKKGQLDPGKVGDYLLMVRNNAGLLAMFIQNLLEVSRIEQAKVDLKPRRADLADVVRSAVEFVKPLADEKGVPILFTPNGKVRMFADVDKLQQVFCNLLSNAVKFTDSGEIRVEIRTSDGLAAVAVTDTGRGIESRYLGDIFEKFFQVPAGHNLQKEGTGLGLAIVKGWVEAHGGSVRAASEGLGRGTTFVVEIPLVSAALESEFEGR